VLSKEQNELITLTGPGTPGGDLMRRYWQPVALSEELPINGDPKAVRILSEDLVLFRDEHGRPGLLDLHCAHRGSDLSYGRIEAGGLRCLYHGWLYAVDGRCLEQPGEPADSTFKDRVRQLAYPCVEKGGLVLTYMGRGEPPRVPELPYLNAPDAARWCTKVYHACNYLQGNEGNIDPQHLSFLHRFLEPTVAYGGLNELTTKDVAPTIAVEEADYGVRIFTVRDIGEGEQYVRITNFIMPNVASFAGGLAKRTGELDENIGYQLHWHVPIDDTHHWKYVLAFQHAGIIDKEHLDRTVKAELDERYMTKRNADNRYLQDRKEMQTVTFAGLGFNFQAHDQYATESQRPIADRSKEHLGTTDRAISLARQQLLQGVRDVQEGREPRLVSRDPSSNPLAEMVVRADRLPRSVDWRTYWRDTIARPGQPVPLPA
jgi:phenylpropionate dioxygenase-like ring-hydroxylating dioxygenase large terminal subunit